jgi:hypothetical protein
MRALLDRWCVGFGEPGRGIPAVPRLPRTLLCGMAQGRPDAALAAATHAEMGG